MSNTVVSVAKMCGAEHPEEAGLLCGRPSGHIGVHMSNDHTKTWGDPNAGAVMPSTPGGAVVRMAGGVPAPATRIISTVSTPPPPATSQTRIFTTPTIPPPAPTMPAPLLIPHAVATPTPMAMPAAPAMSVRSNVLPSQNSDTGKCGKRHQLGFECEEKLGHSGGHASYTRSWFWNGG